MTLRAIQILGAFVPVLLTGLAGCSGEETSETKWTCSNVKVPSGTSVECVATVTVAVEGSTTYDCVEGSADCPSGTTLDGPPLGSTADGANGSSSTPGGSTSDGADDDDSTGDTSDGENGSRGSRPSGGGSTSDGSPDYCPSCWGGIPGDGDSHDGDGWDHDDSDDGSGSSGGGGSNGGGTGPKGGGGSSGGGGSKKGNCPHSKGGGGNDGSGGGSSSGGGSYGGGSGPHGGGGGDADGGSSASPPKKGGGGGDGWTCVKEGCKRTCHKTPICETGTHSSKCGACVPDGQSDDCTPPAEGGCWVTGGGFTEDSGSHKSCGGNGMPMKDGSIRGKWTHVDHDTGNVLHGDVKYLACKHVDEAGPGNPGGKNKGFDQNQVNFGGEARWAKDEAVWFDVVAKDHGEPGNTDEYTITIRKLSGNNQSGTIILQTGGTLVGGNIQIHPSNNGHPFVSSSVPTWVKQ